MTAGQAATAAKRLWSGTLGRGPQIIAVLLILGLMGAMLVEPTRQLLQQKTRIASMEEDLHKTEKVNRRLKTRIQKLQDPDFIEQRAREQVGLVKPGEMAIVVMPPSKERQEKLASERKKALAERPPPEPNMVEGFLRFVGLL